ncbi:MAG: hypothetical protein AUH36_00850 [Chloroflexi bacterium 13_1_40CM_55_7]|nr:MAG: hypothetical protein AUH36_00850 [Chloroflexi bacterium 13_1_40CM_55_7]
MRLAEKIRYLREVEGSLRSLGRPMTQQELVRAIRKERGKSISQSYISQIESGARPHMTQSTRGLLAQFFKVHPGFLVDDPADYHTELSEVLLKAAREKDTRRCFLLLGAILDTPGLAERLLEALKPDLRKPATSRSHRRTEERRRSK